MATTLNTPESGNDNPAARSPAQAAWSAAWSAYEPTRVEWEDEYERADAMPDSHDKDAAFHQFYKVNLPLYQEARDQFMRVPAPNIGALAKKMEFADPTNEEHHDICLDDARRLAGEWALS